MGIFDGRQASHIMGAISLSYRSAATINSVWALAPPPHLSLVDTDLLDRQSAGSNIIVSRTSSIARTLSPLA